MGTESGYILIGRKANGEKVYVQARFKHLPDKVTGQATYRESTEHHQSTDRLTLSITGVVVSKYGSIDCDGSWLGCGQTTAQLLELTSLEPAWPVGDVTRLYQIWTAWHLNDMNAGCDHQHRGGESRDCPETGYKYGSKWLFKSLPFEVFSWVSDHFEIEPPEPGSTPPAVQLDEHNR